MQANPQDVEPKLAKCRMITLLKYFLCAMTLCSSKSVPTGPSEAGNASAVHLMLQVSMGGENHLPLSVCFFAS